MATISTLAVNLIARTSVFEKNMKRSRKNVKSFGTSVNNAAFKMKSFAKGLLASGGVVLALRSVTNAASRAEETMNLFNTVFAENAAETAKWADSFASDIGRSKTEVKEWASSLQDTFVPLGFARKRASELSKTLVELAVDVASFKNIASDREVIDSFTSAIVGNHRAVRAYGVVITNATIEAASFKAGLNRTFTELTELEKVQLRYNIIMDSTKDAQGDAAKTANTYANQIKKLKGQWEDLKETLGKKVIPTINKLVTVLNDNFKALARNILKIGVFIAKTAVVVKTIQLVGKTILGLVRIYKSLAAAQTITLALGGPAGWATLAAGVGIATVAIVGINSAIDDTIGSLSGLKVAQESTVGNFVKQLETEAEVLSAISKEMRQIDFWNKKREKSKSLGTFITGLEFTGLITARETLKSLNSQLRSIRDQKRERTAMVRVEKERLAQIEVEKAAIKSVGKFIGNVQDQIAAVGVEPLFAQLDKMEKLGDSLTGEAWVEWNKGMNEAADLINDLNFSKLNEGVTGFIRRMQDQVDSFGVSSVEAELLKLKKASGIKIDALSFGSLAGLKDELAKAEKAKEDFEFNLAKDALPFEDQEAKFEGILDEIYKIEDQIDNFKSPALFKTEGLAKLNDEFNRASNLIKQIDAQNIKESLVTDAQKQALEVEKLNGLLNEGFLTTEEHQKALSNLGTGFDTPSGRFQEVRSEFVDVAALNAGNSNRGIEKSNALLEEATTLLKQIKNQGEGTARL